MIRRPPRSTLFPTRRSSDLFFAGYPRRVRVLALGSAANLDARFNLAQAERLFCMGPRLKRSEEHTSELQSLAYLVCRLLLEKKKSSSDQLKVAIFCLLSHSF